MNRRSFFTRCACGSAGVVGATTAATATTQAPEALPISQPRRGEPFDVPGKRLVFTNWHFVRPGGYSWRTKDGKGAGTDDSMGPWDAVHPETDAPYGVRLVAQQAERWGPILRPENASERPSELLLTTIIQDGGLFRAWSIPNLTGLVDRDKSKLIRYFESADGLNWKRPKLGLFEHDGSRANNVVRDVQEMRGGTIFIDPSAPPPERYKWVGGGGDEPVEEYMRRRPNAWEMRPGRSKKSNLGVGGIVGAVSPDGLRWKVLPKTFLIEPSDTQITAYYDEELRKYVIYVRKRSLPVRSKRVPEDPFHSGWLSARRSIGRTESDLFGEFPLSEIVMEPGPELGPSDTYYTNCRTNIPGSPALHLMFPAIWHQPEDTTSIAVASSHSGKLWHTVPGSPVATTAPTGQWDGGHIFAHPNLLELRDGRWALPYTGYDVPHKYPRGQMKFATGYLIWSKGRLVALDARERGQFTTMAITPRGRKLRLNVLTQRAGRVLVEIVGEDGKPLPGRSFAEASPVVGDHQATPVTWNGETDLGYRDGTCIRLRFRMQYARIFGLEFD